MIHIAYSIWNYSKTYYIFTGISMTSVMENTKAEVCFHILHDETLGEREQAEMKRLCAKWNQRIAFHFAHLDDRISRRDLYGSGYGDGIFFRIYLPNLLPEEGRVLYLDSDIIVEMDIEKLWQLDLQGNLVGAVWDPPKFGYLGNYVYDRERMRPFIEQIDWNAYFNSGVLLMDLEQIRKKHDLTEETVRFFKQFPMRFPDQDALNWILKGQAQLLDSAYNTFAYLLKEPKKGVILHYTKFSNGKETLDVRDQWVLSYWKKSIWFDAAFSKADQVRMLADLKNTQYVKEKRMALGNWSEKEWWDTPEKIYNQRSEIPADQEERFCAGMREFKVKRYAPAMESFKSCLYYGTDEANNISLRSLHLLTKCALCLKDWVLAEEYNRMVGVLSPESEPYKVNRLLIDWKRQNQKGL